VTREDNHAQRNFLKRQKKRRGGTAVTYLLAPGIGLHPREQKKEKPTRKSFAQWKNRRVNSNRTVGIPTENRGEASSAAHYATQL